MERQRKSHLTCCEPFIPLTNSKRFESMCEGNSYMIHPAFPMEYPTNGDFQAPMGLIPVKLDIEGLYEDHDRRRRMNGNEKSVASHVHSVNTRL